jgi:hypothetical protein
MMRHRYGSSDNDGASFGAIVDNVGVITLPEVPRLMCPTPLVRTSYLVGEQAD